VKVKVARGVPAGASEERSRTRGMGGQEWGHIVHVVPHDEPARLGRVVGGHLLPRVHAPPRGGRGGPRRRTGVGIRVGHLLLQGLLGRRGGWCSLGRRLLLLIVSVFSFMCSSLRSSSVRRRWASAAERCARRSSTGIEEDVVVVVVVVVVVDVEAERGRAGAERTGRRSGSESTSVTTGLLARRKDIDCLAPTKKK
jgi:hypothetical protein